MAAVTNRVAICPVRDMILVEENSPHVPFVPLGTRFSPDIVSLSGLRVWGCSPFYQYHVPNGTDCNTIVNYSVSSISISPETFFRIVTGLQR